MKIGNYECLALETGRFALDGGAMFGVVPRVLWEKKSPPDELNRIEMVTRSLLIKAGERIILVDTGVGEKWGKKQRQIYKIDTASVNLLNGLQQMGLTTEDITDVIITHLHFDHTGGSTVEVKGVLRPTFPRAAYWINARHWEYAHAPTPKDRSSFLRENFDPLAEASQLRLLEDETELLPGLKIVTTNGHTPGQQHVLIESEGRTLFHCGDIIPTSLHLPLPWIMAYDNYPVTTLEEKQRILQWAVKEDWILFFEHDPQVMAATVKEGEKGMEINQVISL